MRETEHEEIRASAAGPYFDRVAGGLSQLGPRRSVMTDLVYRWSTIPHRAGNAPNTLNALWAEAHACISTIRAAFAAGLWNAAADNPGPSDVAPGNDFRKILGLLKP